MRNYSSKFKVAVIDTDLAEKIKEQYGQKEFEHLRLSGGISFAALDGEKVIGFIALSWRGLPYSAVASESEAFIEIIEVDKNYRRQGVAKALLDQAGTSALGHGCYQLRAWSSEDKEEAIMMWRGLGFGLHPQKTISELTHGEISGYFATKPL